MTVHPTAASRQPELAAMHFTAQHLIGPQVFLRRRRTRKPGRCGAGHGRWRNRVSRAIAALEDALGAPLLDRSRGSTATPLGGSVIVAPILFDAAATFRRDVSSLLSDDSTPLRVSASMTVAEHLMPGWL